MEGGVAANVLDVGVGAVLEEREGDGAATVYFGLMEGGVAPLILAVGGRAFCEALPDLFEVAAPDGVEEGLVEVVHGCGSCVCGSSRGMASSRRKMPVLADGRRCFSCLTDGFGEFDLEEEFLGDFDGGCVGMEEDGEDAVMFFGDLEVDGCAVVDVPEGFMVVGEGEEEGEGWCESKRDTLDVERGIAEGVSDVG
jgi:hypothetical protein